MTDRHNLEESSCSNFHWRLSCIKPLSEDLYFIIIIIYDNTCCGFQYITLTSRNEKKKIDISLFWIKLKKINDYNCIIINEKLILQQIKCNISSLTMELLLLSKVVVLPLQNNNSNLPLET